ncbi:MAG: SLC26A/SulP transporter family protein [Leptonema sp. (in: Bacteria)]|nr:SLC26A/SulP transporter family protein [Leptonema sp. (in: bacteria)]
MKTKFLKEVSSGVMTTLLGIPKSIALGLVAFAPLGSSFSTLAVIAGLVSLTVGNLLMVNRKGASIVNSGPYTVSALMISSAALSFSNQYQGEVVVQLLLVIVLFSGVIQFVLGILKFGTIAKYIPYPVFSGLLNGSAILLLLPQIKPIFGESIAKILNNTSLLLSLKSLIGISVACITILSYSYIKLLNQRKRFSLPTALIALIIGSLAFYIFIYFFNFSINDMLIGSVSVSHIQFLFTLPNQVSVFQTMALPILSFSFSIALVNSLSTFLSQGISDTVCQERTDPNAELLNQGVANFVSAIFGGLSIAGSSSRTKAAFDYGARSYSSRIAGGLFALCVLIWASPILSVIPVSVLAAILIILSFSLFDRWLLKQFKSLKEKSHQIETIMNISISILVTVIMIFIGMIEAVTIGALLSIVIFVTTMSRGIIKREFDGRNMRSNTERPQFETTILDEFGSSIRIIELEGYLYFGTADELLRRTDELLRLGCRHIIIDAHQIKSIDTSGLMIIEQIVERCRNAGTLIISVAEVNTPLNDNNLLTDLAYEYLDDGLAVVEDLLIESTSQRIANQTNCMSLSDIDILSSFSASELSILEPYLTLKTYSHGTKVMAAGEMGNSVFMIINGRAELYTTNQDGKYHCFHRLSPGTVFGEMAMIDNKPRSADVLAAGSLQCWVLTVEKLLILQKKNPQIAYQLMTGVAGLLSRRIRQNLNIIAQYRK